jgi:hypothetical protein
LDYAQESGRAGRDGLRSEAVMIVQEGEQRAAEDKQTEAEQHLVRAYVGIDETATCRRVVLDGYLDRRETERVACKEGEEKCDVCRRADGAEDDEEVEEASESSESSEDGSSNEEEMNTAEAERDEAQRDEARRVFEQQQQARRGPRQTIIQQRQQEFADIEWLWWTKRCGICEAAGEAESGHDVRQCWRIESREAKEIIKAVEEKIRFEAYSGCFWCGVPQEVCNRWEDNGRGRHQRAEGKDCQYRGVLVGGLFRLVHGSDGVAER